jgi:hypothetical protein
VFWAMNALEYASTSLIDMISTVLMMRCFEKMGFFVLILSITGYRSLYQTFLLR